MSEEAKDKKLTKKKSTTSSKKTLKDDKDKSKDTSKDKSKDKKKSTSSKKSSVSGSKKGESPTASRDELPTLSIDKDNKEKPSPEEQPLPPVEQNTPGFTPTGQMPPVMPAYGDPRFQQQPQYNVPPVRSMPKPIPTRMCVHHNQPLRYYCEACEEPICEDCHSMGPHNTELHRVATCQEAFNSRYNYLSSGTYKTLLEKRDKLLAQLDKIDYRIGEIKSVAGIIERDIKTEYAGMLERLKSAEGVKYAVLQHDMAEIQKDIERIDSIFDSLDEYLQGDLRGDYIGFLIKFRELHEYIEYSITKPFKVKIDIVPNDLPRELTEKRKLLEKAEQAENLLKLKDEIIWNLVQEKKKLSKMAEIDLDKAVQQEWNEWAKLVEKYYEELVKYQLVCSFCGSALDEMTVNQPCPGSSLSKPLDSKYTLEEPPAEYKGSGRHYFCKPIKNQGQTQSFTQKIMTDPRVLNALNLIKEGGREKFAELKRRLSELDTEQKDEIMIQEFKDTINSLYSNIEDEAITKLSDALQNQSKKVVYRQLIQQVESGIKNSQTETIPTAPAPAPISMLPPVQPPSNRYAKSGPDEIHDKPTPEKPIEKPVENIPPAQKVIGNIKKKGLVKEDLLKLFEKYDESKKGTIGIDQFYLVIMKMDFVVSNQEIEALAKFINPELEKTGEISYTEFINKII